jgi:HSP20 family protein
MPQALQRRHFAEGNRQLERTRSRGNQDRAMTEQQRDRGNDDIFDVFDRMFFSPWSLAEVSNAAERPHIWKPVVDISEAKDKYTIHAELPGMKKEDVKLDITDNVLTLRGERRLERQEEDKEKRYSRVERQYGSFMRRFPLPKDVDVGNIQVRFCPYQSRCVDDGLSQANYHDGVLDITLPRQESKSKSVEINVK